MTLFLVFHGSRLVFHGFPPKYTRLNCILARWSSLGPPPVGRQGPSQTNILICVVWNWICLIVDVRKCSKRNPRPSNIFLQDECTRKGSLQAIDISMDKNQVLNSEATLIDKSCDRQRLKKSSVCSFASSLDSKQVSSLVHRAERRKKISLCTIPDIVTTVTSVGSVNNLAKCKMF